MKKLLFLLALLLNSVWTSAQFSGSGSGTSSDPYLIFNPIQLDQVSNFLGTSGVYFKLMSNIDVSEYISENNPAQGWQPIGSGATPFKGVFDGNGKTISGLRITRTTNYIGFFGYLSGATIKNLNINATTIEGATAVGGIIGGAENSTISNCSFSGDVKSIESGYWTAGISGSINGCTITNCDVKGNIYNSYLTAGGIVGFVTGESSSKLENVKYEGTINGNQYVGGLIGEVNQNSTLTLKSSSSKSNIYAFSYVGGLIGKNGGAGEISTCGHNGDISAKGDYVGGLIGKFSSKTTITNNYAIGNIKATGNYIGGIVGGEEQNKDIVSFSTYYSNDDVYVYYPSYMIVKCEYYEYDNNDKYYKENDKNYKYKKTKITNDIKVTCKFSNNQYEINNFTAFPGYQIVGRTYYKSTNHGYNGGYKWTGDIVSNEAKMSSSGKYDYCYACILIDAGKIQNNYYNGNILGKDYVGGIIGYINPNDFNLSITKNYSNGNISGNDYVGGIIGSFYNIKEVKSNVSINPIISAVASNVGRIYGRASSEDGIGASGTNDRNIALTTTKVSVNGVPKTVEDNLQNGDSRGLSTLKYKATYQGIGWDFNKDWSIQDTECFPYSPTQTAPPLINGNIISGMTSISGKSVSGGNVYVNVDGEVYETSTSSNTWSVTVPELQSGASIYAYAKEKNLDYSYRTSTMVAFAGSGTEADPYQIYTASDLANINSASYYKLMKDIDLTSYINSKSPTAGWVPVGRNATAMRNFNGNGHKITGLWCNTTEDYTGLFASISNATITDLTIEVASDKQMKGGNYTGILVGKQVGGTIKNCNVIGNVNGGDNTGALAGYMENVTVKDCSESGNVTGKDYTAGLIGKTDNSTLSGIRVNGDITGTVNVAGISTCVSKNMTDVIYDGNIRATGNNALVGGIVTSALSGATITLASSKGTINANGSSAKVGGIVAENKGNVTDCYSTMSLVSTDYVAGIVAYNYGKVSRCYASGNMKGTNIGAGVVGYNDGKGASIENCFAINKVIDVTSSTGIAMRVLGGFKNDATVPTMNNIALKTMAVSVNGVAQKVYDDVLNGTSKTEDVFSKAETYTTQGWDFNSIWTINEDKEMPYLKSELKNTVSVSSVVLDKQTLTLKIGGTYTLTATITPEDATTKELTWTSSNPNVATVESGMVTALATGTTNITATATDGSEVNASCEIKVIPAIVPVTEIKFNKSNVEIETGKTFTLSATITPEDATTKELTWTSSNPNVATVENGMVTALATGTTTITATATDGSEVSANCEVTVKSKSQSEADTDYSTMDNAIYSAKAEGKTGSQFNLPISLKNVATFSGFQFDLYLPEGITVALDEYDEPIMERNERINAKTTLEGAVQTDGCTRFLCYSTKNYAITGNDGDIMSVTLNIADDIKDGDYPIYIKNIVLNTTAAEVIEPQDMKSTISISSYTLGDINNDGKINVGDIGGIASYILGTTPAVFIEKAADYNQDTKINVGDIGGIANFILYGAQTELAKSKAFMPMAGTETQAKVFVSPFTIQPGEEKDIEVELTNPDYPVAGAQFDVYLPKGISVVMDEYDEPTISGNRSSKITTEGAIQENGSLRVLAYSSKNYTYSGTEGSIVTITIKADDDIKSGVYDLNIKETVINKYVDKVITTIEPEDYTCSVIVGTPTESSLTLYGNITAETMEELSEALKGNTSLAYIDLRQATNVDAEGVLTSGNKNMLVYLAEGMSIGNTENVIVNNECENLVLTDNADFAPIVPFTATSATMEKPAEDDGWYTMYLPYAFTPSEDVKVYTFEEAQGNTLVFAQQEGEVPAGTPMLCKRGEGTTVMSFSAENVTITTEGVVGGQFIGTFTEIPAGAVTGSYILNATGTAFGKATEKAYVPAFHCYYVADNSSSVDIKDEPIDSDARSNVLNIVIKDVTGVKSLNMDLNEDVYSWQGFKGEGQINIKNRKKFVK